MSILPPFPRFGRGFLPAAALLTGLLAAAAAPSARAQAVAYTGIVVFGDSLSDTGNVAATTESDFGIRYPSPDFNYADGRFTSSGATNPDSVHYQGVWHEQLCQLFLNIPTATASLNGGTDYAFGDAETLSGQRKVSVYTDISIHIDDLGRQVANYLDGNVPDPGALYTVWCGANDLFAADATSGSSQSSDDKAATTAATNVTAAIERLARAGAVHILVNNLPPIGETPEYRGHPDESARLTNASATFGAALDADLATLLGQLSADGITIDLKRLDVYGLFTRLLATQGIVYGFDNITDSAQGQSVKADRYLFWDGVHPTAAGHFQLAAEAYTLLTGIPVVEINGQLSHVDRNAGEPGHVYLTRTGEDVSSEFKIYYAVGGSAVEGQDYEQLRGIKLMGPGARTRSILVYPDPAPAGTSSVKLDLTLQPGPDYALPAYPLGSLHLDAD